MLKVGAPGSSPAQRKVLPLTSLFSEVDSIVVEDWQHGQRLVSRAQDELVSEPVKKVMNEVPSEKYSTRLNICCSYGCATAWASSATVRMKTASSDCD